MKRLSLFIILSMFSICMHSQPPQTARSGKKTFSVSGSVIDSELKQAVEFASVAIYALPDTVLVTGAISDETGKFSLSGLSSGRYILESSFIGYRSTVTQVTISDGSVALPAPILLEPLSISLRAGQVTSERNERQTTVEKTKINVSRNISSVSGSITEVLKGQSSVSIDGDGSLYLRGNKNILILIDGIPTTVSALNSIPASNVDNIEIITNPDVKYDSEGTGGIINIVTKRDGLAGFSGAATLNYGIYNKVNGGINLHYSKGIWDMGLNYSGRYENADVVSSLERQLHSLNTSVQQNINANQTNSTHTLGFRLNAKPTQKDLISFVAKFMMPRMNNIQSIDGTQTEGGQNPSSFNRLNDITFNRKVFEGSLSYKRIFEKARNELSVTASFSRTRGTRPAEYYLEDELLQKSSGGGTPTNYTIQADWLKSVSQSGKIETGLKAFSRWNSFEYEFYDYIQDNWALNTEFSNNLEHQEYIYSAYLMYSDTLFKKLDFKAGVRTEYNTTDLIQKSTGENISKDYFFPFPYLQMNYRVNQSNSLALSVNRRITRPTYPQQNPFIYVIDRMTYETGNKTLEPEVLDKVEMNHSFTKEKINLRSSIYYSSTKRFITQVSMLSSADRLLMTYVNGNVRHSIGGDMDLTWKICKHLWFNPSASLFWTKSDGAYNEIDLRTDGLAWTANLKTIIRPEKKTEVQLFLNYNSPMELPQFTLDRIYYADIAVKRTFLQDKLSVSLTLTDIFNTRNWNISSNNQIYNLVNKSKNDTRVLWIGLTYNFNSFKPEKSKKPNSEVSNRKMIRIGAID